MSRGGSGEVGTLLSEQWALVDTTSITTNSVVYYIHRDLKSRAPRYRKNVCDQKVLNDRENADDDKSKLHHARDANCLRYPISPPGWLISN